MQSLPTFAIARVYKLENLHIAHQHEALLWEAKSPWPSLPVSTQQGRKRLANLGGFGSSPLCLQALRNLTGELGCASCIEHRGNSLITAQRCSLRGIDDITACHLWYVIVSDSVVRFTGCPFRVYVSAGGPRHGRCIPETAVTWVDLVQPETEPVWNWNRVPRTMTGLHTPPVSVRDRSRQSRPHKC